MKITRVTAWQLDLLSEPYWLSGGRLKFEKLDSTFVRIDTDEGVSAAGARDAPGATPIYPPTGPAFAPGWSSWRPP